MILEDSQKFEIIMKNPNYDLIQSKRDRSDILRMHVTGNPKLIDKYVQDVPEFMREGMKDTIVSLIRGNQDVIHRVLNARDSIYNAKGGIEQYNVSETQEPEFRAYLSKCADGMPLKEWIRQKAQKRTDFDPDGLTFMEVNEDGNPFPVLYSIDTIYDYVIHGRTPEYIIFLVDERQKAQYMAMGLLPPNITKTDKVFRVVDDITDCLIVKGARFPGGFYIASEIENPFGFVPGIINSDLCGVDDCCFDSPIEVCVMLLNSLMFGQGTYALAYARQAFPKEWMQIFECPTCEGTGVLDGAPCPECNGKKILPFMKQADVMKVDYRKDINKSVPTPPAGTITPDVEALRFMFENTEWLERIIYLTIWGKPMQNMQINGPDVLKKPPTNVSATAFEAALNDQPEKKRLELFQKWRISIQKFVSDCCGKILYDVNDVSVLLGGTNFMIESPDATLQRYNVATNSLIPPPKAELDSLYIEYIENKYNANPFLYRKYLLLFLAEPFSHKTEEQVNLYPVPDVMKLEKIMYDNWTSTLPDSYFDSIPDNGGVFIMKSDLRAFVTGEYQDGMIGDAQLFSPNGDLLGFKVGDSVQIRPGKAKKPEHYGQTFKINAIVDGNVTLTGGGSDGTFGYQMNDLKKPSNKMIEAA